MYAFETASSPSRTLPGSQVGWPDAVGHGPATGLGMPPARWASSPAQDAEHEIKRPNTYRTLSQPPGWRPTDGQALGRPYVWEGGEQPGEPITDAGRPRPATHARPANASEAERRGGQDDAKAPDGPGRFRERAVIGDLLRQLAVWCEIGPCIARHTDTAALGEADIRRRALTAGWCVDAFGRLVCPACQQHYPIWAAYPPARFDDVGNSMRRTVPRIGQHRRTTRTSR